MAVVTRPLSAFVASGGIVAFDRLEVEVLDDPIITSTYFTGLPSITNPSTEVSLFFADPLSAGEVIALDAIIASHNGANLPLGATFTTSHTILSSVTVAAQAVSFVDATFEGMGTLSAKNQRFADADGRLKRVAVQCSVGATVTVQRIGNGSLVGSGVTISLGANIWSTFVLPLSEGLYTEGGLVGIALTGLSVGSDNAIEGVFEEAI